jgi:hypothetical protein
MPFTPGMVLGGLRVDLGSVQLGAVDANSVAWALQTMEGWDSPEIRSEYTVREADHGSWASPVYLGSRPITLAGTITAPSRALLESSMDQLRAAASLSDTQLTVWETVPKQATVRISGKLLIQYVTDAIATYSVLVTAADPRRYGTSPQTGTTMLPSTTGGLTLPIALPLTIASTTVSGQVDAPNAGTFESRPRFTITGPVTAPQILCAMPDGSVQFLNYSQDLASGESLVIDTDTHTVVLNGNTSRRRYLSVPTGWPVIPAGQSVSFQFRSTVYNATASLTVSWRSAWI